MAAVVKRAVLFVVLAGSALALPAVAEAARCGLSGQPLWIEHGHPDVEQVFGRRGVTVAVSTGDFPAKMRARGARTVYWDMNFARRVGTPFAPADPATIVERADRLFDFAARQSGCRTPLIALNEMNGANLETPWSDTNAQYRANVMTFVRRLAERGARPYLLIPNAPYTDGEAADWWREVSKYADLVREVYFSGRTLYGQGPILANRRLRAGMRRGIAAFTEIGIPASRVGLVLGFQTRSGGREGLEPAAAWFRVVKWQVLAARQVAREMRIATVWSWGWASYRPDPLDRDKPAAACVYLWTRDAKLCDGPSVAGARFVSSRTEGQLSAIRPGHVCTIGQRGISAGAVSAVQRITGDRDVAFTVLLARLAEASASKVERREVLAAERAVVSLQFAGRRGAYIAALRKSRATVGLARAALADEVRRARVEARMRGRRPSADEVTTFYFSYPELVVRPVRARPAPAWLGRRPTGLALRSLAPERVFSLPAGRRVKILGLDRFYTVTALGPARPLGSVPLAQARPAIGAALASFARKEAFERWTLERQSSEARRAICRRDDVPEPGTVRLTGYLPFLSLAGA